MATYIVTTSNWNSAAFWSGISETATGHTLDFSGLGVGYRVDVNSFTGIITISDGVASFTVGEAGVTGTNANFGGTTLLDYFTTIEGTQDADYVFGTDSNDVLDGNAGNDSLYGQLGDDTLYGNGGADVLDGNEGSDLIYGGADNDRLFGWTGDDSLFGETGNDTLFGEAGNDSLSGGAGADLMYGGDGADTLEGGWEDNSADTMFGEAGDDLIFSYGGNDSVNGGLGNDWIDGGAGNDSILGDGNEDRIVGDLGIDTIRGGAGFDILTGGEGADLIDGGDDADAIWGNAGDTIIGGEGGADFDTLYVSHVNFISYSTAESGTVTFNSGQTLQFSQIESVVVQTPDGVVDGTAGDDQLGQFYFDADGEWIDNGDAIGEGDGDSVRAGAGNDTVWSNDGNDTVHGEAGNDQISLGGGNNVAFGGAGADTIEGEWQNDTISGDDVIASGPNLIVNGSFEDTTGMSATWFGFSGAGTAPGWTDANGFAIEFHNDGRGGLLATDGANWLDLEANPGQQNFVRQTVSGVQDGQVYVLTFDAADLSDIDDGTTQDNQLQVIWNGEVVGTIDAVDGAWRSYEFHLIGGAGDGTNTLAFAGLGDASGIGASLDNVQMFATTEAVGDADSLTGWDGNDDLIGGAGNDTIDGGGGADMIVAGSGDDSVLGDWGNDTIWGGTGNDTIDAGAENDIVWAGAGADSILGGTGNDTLSGNTGADTIDGGDGADSLQGGQGGDRILGGAGNDFILGDGQWYNLSDYASGPGLTATNLTVTNGADGPIELWWIDGSGTAAPYATIQAGDTHVQATFTDHNWVLRDTDGYWLEVIAGAPNQTVVYGAEGLRDRLVGDAGNDTILGQFGSDTLYGGDGNDSLVGGAGNDYFETDAGADTIIGGTGFDQYWASNGFDGDVVDLGGDEIDNTTVGFSEYLSFDMVTSSTDIIFTSATGGTATSGAGESLTFSNVDGFEGGGAAGGLFDARLAGFDVSFFDYGGTTVVYGSAYDDELNGQWGLSVDRTIDGGAGNDYVSSRGGNDTLLGGTGHDTINAGAGNDFVLSGSGNDVVDGGDGNDVIYGGTGNDTLFGGEGVDNLFGQAGDDVVSGQGGSDQIYVETGGGNDTLIGGETNETGTGDVVFVSNTVNSTVILTGNEAGTITMGTQEVAFSEIERILLSTSNNTNDLMDASVATQGISFGAGLGDDTLIGGSGNDFLWGQDGNDLQIGGAGNDTIQADQGNDTLIGGLGNDRLLGGADADLFSFADGFGNDTIIGGETVTTGVDFDTIDLSALTTGVTVTYTGNEAGTITDGSNTITFSEIEQIILTDQADVVNGGSGNEVIDGRDGDDTISTGTGNDSILGGAGNDSLIGGDGNDTVDGGAGDDYVAAFVGDDSLSGGDGNDTIFSLGGGADSIDGGADADLISIRTISNATVTGGETATTGSDLDRLDIAEGTNALTLDFTGNESGTVTDGISTVTFSGIEQVALGDGADTINAGAATLGLTVSGGAGDDVFNASGTSGANAFEGDGGNDSIFGGSGDETLGGGSGNDYIAGEAGNDSITGGGDNDTLLGGLGNDTLDGSQGNDLILGGDGDDLVLGGDGADTITGGAGSDQLVGGGDADTFVFADGFGADTISGGESITTGTDFDTIDLSAVTTGVTATFTGDEAGTITDGTNTITFSEIEQLSLTEQADAVDATADPNGVLINAAGGDDTITGSTASDILQGGAGDDVLVGNAGNDQIFGGDGSDLLLGGAGDDLLDGGADADVFQLADNFGNDTIVGGETTTTGFGRDILDLSAVTSALTIDLTAANRETGTVSDGTSTAQFSEIETVVLGSGTDTLVLADGGGSDFVTGFAAPIDNGDGTYTGQDQLDVSGLTSDGTTPIHAGNVVVTEVGGSAVLTFPGGESLTLTGVPASQVSDIDALVAMGIPDARDFIVEGTAGADLIDAAYTGDPEGDRVDALDNGAGTNNDVIDAGAGNDTVSAGLGDDLVYGWTGNDSLSGGDGNDTLFGQDGDDTLFGGAGNDSLDGDDFGIGADSLSGEAGNDTLIGDAGNDTLLGGADDDLIFAGADDDSVEGGTGNDQIFGETGNDFLDGGAGDDTILGGDGADTIIGFEGNDSVDAGAGDDVINTRTSPGTGLPDEGYGATGNPLYYPGDPAAFNDRDTVDGGIGNDTILTGDDNDIIFGGEGNDSVDAGFDDDSVFGGAGMDFLEGNEGNDTIDGGDDADVIYGDVAPTNPDYPFFAPYDLPNDGTDLAPNNNADSLIGGAGNDTIFGQDDNDTLIGGTGNDYLDGGNDDDVLDGGDGADTLIGGAGNDTLNGGHDDDSVDGGAGNDWLTGDLGNDTVRGGDGDDSVFGAEGDDVMFGDAGNDSMEGWLGNDSMYGGDGDDYMDASVGDDLLEGGDGNDTLLGGSDIGADTLRGGAGNDELSAGGGDDILDGGEGADVLFAADGNDLLDGGAGDDTLDGWTENDTLAGGLGNDLLTGGDGTDVFVYVAGDGLDTITDFSFGNTGTLNDGDLTNNDRIDLSAFYDNIWELTADFNDDGILNQSNDGVGAVDYSNNATFGGGGVVILGATGDKTSFTFESTGVVCFTSGTRILTPTGEQPIETLRVGDRVITRDNGVQTLRWIGHRHLDTADFVRNPKLRPILLSPDLTGGDAPLIVSPQHGVLFSLDGEETLVRATHLAKMQGGAARVMKGCRQVTYFHILFDEHQIVFANGAPSESFFPGSFAMSALQNDARSEIFELFPELQRQNADTGYGQTARDFARLSHLPDHLKALTSHKRQRLMPGTALPMHVMTANPATHLRVAS